MPSHPDRVRRNYRNDGVSFGACGVMTADGVEPFLGFIDRSVVAGVPHFHNFVWDPLNFVSICGCGKHRREDQFATMKR